MDFESIVFEQADGIAFIRMNRPKELNTLSMSLVSDLLKAIEICWDDSSIKTVILTGNGRTFCAGGDVVTFKNSPDLGDTARQMTKAFNPLISGIRRMGKPVIAMINGAVMGAGLSLAAVCDLRICAASAVFRQAYTSVGLVPDGAWSLFVPLLIGFGRASEFLLLDPTIDAQKALSIGFVNEVVEDADLERITRGHAVRLSKGPLTAFAIAKENLNRAMLPLLENQLEQERLGIIRAGRTRDAKEGLESMLAKRKPDFRGE